MQTPIILAHGSLGWADELIFLGVIVIFLGMMGVAWFQSRSDDFESDDLMPNADNDPAQSQTDERFQLD